MARELFRNIHGPDGSSGIHVRNSGLGAVPALTVLPLVRWPVGNKVVKPFTTVLAGLALTFGTPFVWVFIYGLAQQPLPANIGWEWLAAWSAFTAVFNLAMWAWRFRGLTRGAEIDQMEAGYSWLAWYMPLPAWFTEILLMPALFIGAGWLLYTGPSRDLGAWWILCGLSLAMLALAELRHRIAEVGAISDAMVRNQTTGARVTRHVGAARTPQVKKGRGKRNFAEAADGPAEPPQGVSALPGEDAEHSRFWFAAAQKPRRQPPRNFAEPSR